MVRRSSLVDKPASWFLTTLASGREPVLAHPCLGKRARQTPIDDRSLRRSLDAHDRCRWWGLASRGNDASAWSAIPGPGRRYRDLRSDQRTRPALWACRCWCCPGTSRRLCQLDQPGGGARHCRNAPSRRCSESRRIGACGRSARCSRLASRHVKTPEIPGRWSACVPPCTQPG